MAFPLLGTALAASIIGGLAQAAGSLVGRVLVSAGIGYAVFSGLDTMLGFVKSFVLSHITALPVEVVQILSTLKFGVAINILASAYTARLIVQGVTGGALKKMIVK